MYNYMNVLNAEIHINNSFLLYKTFDKEKCQEIIFRK